MADLDHERQVAVDALAAELIARFVQEESEHGIEAASRAADAAILGAIRWIAGHDRGHDRIAEITAHLHAEAVAAIALRDTPAPSRTVQ